MNDFFKFKKADFGKLTAYGFKRAGGNFIMTKRLSGCGFLLTVTVNNLGQIFSEVIDDNLNEPYTLHLIDGASGGFVGQVRTDYENALKEIAEQCFDVEIFKNDCTKELIAAVKDFYGDELEFLWEKFSGNAVWRRKDNKKWYAAVLSVSKRKLGFDSDEIAEVIDLRIQPEKLEDLIDNKNYFPAYHMNKKHWFTIILDGSVPSDVIFDYLKDSYDLAKKS